MVKGSLHVAIQSAPDWAKAWHSWALFNVHAMEHYSRSNVAVAQQHVAPAVTAFFKSVALGQASGSAFSSETSTLNTKTIMNPETLHPEIPIVCCLQELIHLHALLSCLAHADSVCPCAQARRRAAPTCRTSCGC